MFTNIDLYHSFLGYKPKVISVDEEPVAIMNSEGVFVTCQRVLFDTGNRAATGISRELVKSLDLENKIDHTKTRSADGVGRGIDGQPIRMEFSLVKIKIKIRGMVFPVKALYDAPIDNTDLLIGMDIIDSLFDEKFTLGK